MSTQVKERRCRGGGSDDPLISGENVIHFIYKV